MNIQFFCIFLDNCFKNASFEFPTDNLVITKNNHCLDDGKYGDRSQICCAQIDFQWLFKSLNHSFKNHKDGCTREPQVLDTKF